MEYDGTEGNWEGGIIRKQALCPSPDQKQNEASAGRQTRRSCPDRTAWTGLGPTHDDGWLFLLSGGLIFF